MSEKPDQPSPDGIEPDPNDAAEPAEDQPQHRREPLPETKREVRGLDTTGQHRRIRPEDDDADAGRTVPIQQPTQTLSAVGRSDADGRGGGRSGLAAENTTPADPTDPRTADLGSPAQNRRGPNPASPDTANADAAGPGGANPDTQAQTRAVPVPAAEVTPGGAAERGGRGRRLGDQRTGDEAADADLTASSTAAGSYGTGTYGADPEEPQADAIEPADPQEAGSEDAGYDHEQRMRSALAHKPVFPRVLQWVVAILTPLMLIMGAVRAVASGAFLWLEYHRPGFPKDDYGFTTDQRMTYGSYGLDYINGFAPREYLSGVRQDGSPLFKDTEVAHMADVQSLVHLGYLVASIALVITLLSFLVLKARYAGGVRRGLFAGAWVTLILLAVLGVMAVLGWSTFFTDFHRLFFSGGNWEFQTSDSLIRLYPPQFWADAAITLGALVLVAVIVILVLTWPTRGRRDRARARQAERDFRLG